MQRTIPNKDQTGPASENWRFQRAESITADTIYNDGVPTVKTRTILSASLVVLFAIPLSAQAQGIIGGGERGAEVGGHAAGPVGGVVGGVVGGAAGGVVGGVKGVVGGPRHRHYSSYHHHHHHYYR